jgi:hypothetical protein
MKFSFNEISGRPFVFLTTLVVLLQLTRYPALLSLNPVLSAVQSILSVSNAQMYRLSFTQLAYALSYATSRARTPI